MDLAVITIPAAKVMDLIPRFEKKGIRNMLLITSGFAETGAEGRELDCVVAEVAVAVRPLVLSMRQTISMIRAFPLPMTPYFSLRPTSP